MTEKKEKKDVLIEDKKIVVPGDVLAEGPNFLAGFGTYKKDEQIKSKILGVVRIKDHFVRVVPLSGIYLPQTGDKVIGKIADVYVSSWTVDINSPYLAFLPISDAVEEFVDLTKTDITEYFDVEDVIYAKIQNVTKRKDVKLTMKDRVCRKLKGGNIIKITPAKVPRLIGKSGSMIEMIKEKTECQIIVGQNGLVWLKGEKIDLAVKAIEMVEEMSHIEGLTDEIKKMLEKGE